MAESCANPGANRTSEEIVLKTPLSQLFNPYKLSKYTKLFDYIIGDIFRNYVKDMRWTVADLEDPAKLNDIYNGVKGKINNILVDKYSDSGAEWKSVSAEAADDLVTIYDNFAPFAQEHLKYSDVVRAKNFELEETPIDPESSEEGDSHSADEDEEGAEEVQQRDRQYDNTGNEVSQVELASRPTRTIFRFIPRGIWNTQTKTSDIYKDKDGLPTPADYMRVWNLLAEKLQGEKNEDKFKDIMLSDQTKQVIPEVQFINEILGLDKPNADMSLSEVNQFISFFQSFSKPKVDLQSAFLSDAEGSFVVSDDILSNKDKIELGFNNNFTSNNIPDEFKKYVKKSTTGVFLLEKSGAEDATFLPPEPADHAAYMNFLKFLGFNFTFENLLDSNQSDAFRTLVASATPRLYHALKNRLEAGFQVKTPIKELKKKEGRIKSEAASIKALVDFESRFSQIAPTHAIRNGLGELQNLINMDSGLSLATYHLNSAQTVKELLQTPPFRNSKYDPQFKTSLIITYLFDEDGNRRKDKNGNQRTVNLTTISSFKIQEAGKRRTVKLERNLSPKFKFIQDFHMFTLYQRTDTIRHEASHSFFSIETLDENGKPAAYINLKAFQNSFTEDRGFVKQVLRYLNGELARIKSFEKKKEENPTLPDEYGSFSIFHRLTDEVKASLVGKTNLDTDDPLFKTFLDDFNRIQVENYTDMKSYMNEIGFSFSQLAKPVRDLGVSFDGLVRAFIAGTWLQNTEYTILYTGDPLFFGEHTNKRIKGLGSTGNAAVDIPMVGTYFAGQEEKRWHDAYSIAGAVGVKTRDNTVNFKHQVLQEPLSAANAYTEPQLIKDIQESQRIRDGKAQSDEEVRESLVLGEPIKIADGQSWITPDSYREFAIKNAFITPEMTVALKYEGLIYRKHLTDEPLSVAQEAELEKLESLIYSSPNKYALPVIKGGLYGASSNSTINAKSLHKTSISPLLPSYVKGKPELLKILQDLVKKQYSYVSYKSAVKGFTTTPIPVQNLGDKGVKADEYPTQLFKEQLKTKSDQKTEAAILTQELKLIFANTRSDGKAKTELMGKYYNQYRGILDNIQTEQRARVLRDLGFKYSTAEKGYKLEDFDPRILSEKLIREAKRQDLDSNIISSLEINPETGTFNTSTEGTGFVKQIFSMVSGILDRSLRSFKFPGGDFVLISNAHQEKLNWYKLGPNGSSSVECRITLTKEYSKLLNKVHKDGERIGTLDRLNKLLKDKEWRAENEKALSVVFGRAPIDGPHSMGHGQVVEFLPPTMGNALILPDEYVKQAGIDFDLDKERVITPSLDPYGGYKTNESDQIRLKKVTDRLNELQDIYPYLKGYEKVETDEVESYEEYQRKISNDLITKIFGVDSRKDLEDTEYEVKTLLEEYKNLKSNLETVKSNAILELYKNVLSSPEMFSELVTPLSTRTIKPLAEANGENTGITSNLPVLGNVLNYMDNLRAFKIFFGAKRLLAAFAKENTTQQLLTYSGININEIYNYSKWNRKEKKYEWLPKRINNLLLTDSEYREVLKGGKIMTSLRDDINGYIKQHLNSEAISAMVDSGKDPFAFMLNLTLTNVSAVNVLKNIGVPFDRIINFISHPALVYYSTLRDNGLTRKQALEDIIKTRLNLKYEHKGISKPISEPELSLPVEELIRRGFIKEGDRYEFSKIKGQNLVTSLTDAYPDPKRVEDLFRFIDEKKPVLMEEFSGKPIDVNKFLKYNQITNDRLKLLANQNNARIDDENVLREGEVVKDPDEANQMLSDEYRILAHYLALEEVGWAMMNFRSYFNHDTNKVSTLTDVRIKQKLKEKVRNQDLVDAEGFEKMEKESILSSFMNDDLYGAIYRQIFPILGNEIVQDALSDIYDKYNNNFKAKNKRDLRNLAGVLDNDFLTSVVHNFGRFESTNVFDTSFPLMTKTETSKESFGDRLAEFRSRNFYTELSRQFPALDRFVTDKSYITDSNDLNGLTEPFILDTIQFIKNIQEGKIEKEAVIDQFRDLLYNYKGDNAEEIKNFVQDLLLLGMTQSGFNKSFISFSEYIPREFGSKIYDKAMKVFDALDEEQKKTYMSTFKRKFQANNPKYFPYVRLSEGEKEIKNNNTYSNKFKHYRFGGLVQEADVKPDIQELPVKQNTIDENPNPEDLENPIDNSLEINGNNIDPECK